MEASFKARVVLLLDGRVRLRWLLLDLLCAGQLRTIPAPAQGLYQRHGGSHLLNLKVIQSLLV